MSDPDEFSRDLAKVVAVLMARNGVTEMEITDTEAATIPRDLVVELTRPFRFTPLDDRALIRLHSTMLAAAPAPPRRDPADRLPRVRNPRIGCELLEGTWVHGRPHSCPRSARGFHG